MAYSDLNYFLAGEVVAAVSGMSWPKFIEHSYSPLMVINYMYFMGMIFNPFKTNAPLIINSNTILSFSIS